MKRKPDPRSISGVPGITPHKATGKWEVKGVGYFTDLADAKAALVAIATGTPVKRDIRKPRS